MPVFACYKRYMLLILKGLIVRFYNLLARHARFRVLQTIYVTHP